jgi:hypothetical protein
VDFDPVEFERAASAGMSFMVAMAGGAEPNIDGHDATRAALQRLYPYPEYGDEVAIVPAELAVEWVTRREIARVAKQMSKEADNRLRAAMGGARVAMTPAGSRFAQRSQYERQGYTTKPSVVDQLRSVKDDGHTD